MKILLFCDNHFSTNSSIIRSIGAKYSTRLENQIESLNWVNQIAIDKGCEKMVHLGDFFDAPNLTAQELSALREIKWNTIPKYFIVGNHEMASSDLEFNSLNALGEIGTVVKEPTILTGFGFELFLLPYCLTANEISFKELLLKTSEEFWKDKFTTQEVKQLIVLSHNDIAGIQYGKYISKAGFNINEITEYCDLFINGHLHNQEQISEKILNLGNLTGQNFSEDGFKYSHCVGILDTETLKIELINNPYAFNFYHIDAKSLDDLKTQITKLNKGYSIGTIKVLDTFMEEAKQLCKEHFREFRLLVTYTSKTTNSDVIAITQENHISRFKTFIHEQLGDNDIVNEELGLL